MIVITKGSGEESARLPSRKMKHLIAETVRLAYNAAYRIR
jgi:hypothetical protein